MVSVPMDKPHWSVCHYLVTGSDSSFLALFEWKDSSVSEPHGNSKVNESPAAQGHLNPNSTALRHFKPCSAGWKVLLVRENVVKHGWRLHSTPGNAKLGQLRGIQEHVFECFLWHSQILGLRIGQDTDRQRLADDNHVSPRLMFQPNQESVRKWAPPWEQKKKKTHRFFDFHQQQTSLIYRIIDHLTP